MAFVATFRVSAEVIELDFSDATKFGNYSNPVAGQFTQVEKGDVLSCDGATITVNYTEGNGCRFFYSTEANATIDFRAYKYVKFTVAAPDQKITSIVIEGDNLGSSYLTAEGYDKGTWSGVAESVEFSCIKSTVKMNKMTITTIGADEKIVAVPTFGGESEFAESTQATISAEEGCKIYWSYDEGDFEDLADCNEYTAPIALSKTTTLYAQAVDGEGNKSAIVHQTYTKLESMTVAQALAAAKGTNVNLTATIFATCNKGAVLGDKTGYMYYFADGVPTVGVGDVCRFTGALDVYSGTNQFPKTTTVEKTGTATPQYPTATALTGAEADAWIETPQIKYVEMTGELVISGNYYNVAIEGAQKAKGSILYPSTEMIGKFTNGTKVKVTGFAMYVSGNVYVNVVATSVEAVGDIKPVEKVEPLALAEFTNGGFEAWTDKKPDQWTPHTTAGNATLEQSTDAHGGQYSVLVKGTSDNKRVATEELLLPAGWYTLTVWAKSEKATAQARPGFVRASFNENQTSYILDSNHYAYFAYTDITSSEWTKIANTFQLEEETILSVVVMNPKNNGNILVDDVELRAATEEEIVAAGVDMVTTTGAQNAATYDLAGRRVNAATRGLLIKGGQKVLVK